MTVAASEIRNISAWRLNKAEMNELAERVKKGEEEAVVKKELQTKKAVACEERKKSAAAISAKPGSTGPKASKKTSSSAATQSATAAATPDPTNAGYYALVEADLLTSRQFCRSSQALTRKCLCRSPSLSWTDPRLGFKNPLTCPRLSMPLGFMEFFVDS